MKTLPHETDCLQAAHAFLAEEVTPDPSARMQARTLRSRFLEWCHSVMLPEVMDEISHAELWFVMCKYLVNNRHYGYDRIVTGLRPARRIRYKHIHSRYVPVCTLDAKYNEHLGICVKCGKEAFVYTGLCQGCYEVGHPQEDTGEDEE